MKIGNDPDSHLKTYASVEGADVTEPGREAQGKLQRVFKVGEPILLSGVAMSGRTPLKKVEYWVRSVDDFEFPPKDKLADNDDELLSAPWQSATIDPPPTDWSCLYPAEENFDTKNVFGFGEDGQPLHWPLPMSYVNWQVTLTDLTPGAYELRARSVDINGYAQPQPRPVQKNGRNAIDCRRVIIEA